MLEYMTESEAQTSRRYCLIWARSKRRVL